MMEVETYPRTGPRKGAAENTIMGLQFSWRTIEPGLDLTHVPTLSFRNVSEMTPPDTVKKADPAHPVQNRKMR